MVMQDSPMLARKNAEVNHSAAYVYVNPAYSAERATWTSARTA